MVEPFRWFVIVSSWLVQFTHYWRLKYSSPVTVTLILELVACRVPYEYCIGYLYLTAASLCSWSADVLLGAFHLSPVVSFSNARLIRWPNLDLVLLFFSSINSGNFCFSKYGTHHRLLLFERGPRGFMRLFWQRSETHNLSYISRL